MNARLDELMAAVESAEAEALVEHLAGRCHLSRWSRWRCEHCVPVWCEDAPAPLVDLRLTRPDSAA